MIEKEANVLERNLMFRRIPSNLYSALTRANAFLAGGAMLATLYNIGDLKDYDFYFRREYDYKFLNTFLDKTHVLLSSTSNAVTWTSRDMGDTTPIQIIKTVFGEPEEILNSFDLGVCKIGYDFSNNRIYRDSDFTAQLERKVTSVGGYERPASTVFRVMKYMDKGFKPDYMDMVRLSVVVSAFSEEEIMNGFDKGYFSPYIETTGLALKQFPRLKKSLYSVKPDYSPDYKKILSIIITEIMENL